MAFPKSKPLASVRHLVFALRLSLAVIACFCARSNAAFAHIYERGHIERSMDMIVRGTEIEIRYSIGLSDETMLDLMIDSNSIAEADIVKFQMEIDKLLEAEQESPAEATASVAPLEFQTELLKMFGETVATQLVKNMTLTANGIAVDFSSETLSLSPRNHVAIEIVLRGRLEKRETYELRLMDTNFLKCIENFSETAGSPSGKTGTQTHKAESSKKHTDDAGLTDLPPTERDDRPFKYKGAIRLACRAKGEAVLVNSSVAPVMARAKPVMIKELTTSEQMTCAQIQAKIVYPKLKPAKR